MKSLVCAGIVLGLTSNVSAAEPYRVTLGYPIQEGLKKEREYLEWVLRDLPAHQAKWSGFSKSTVTYVVKQSDLGSLLSPEPCDALGIRVKIVNGKLVSATYETSGGQCKKGQVASALSRTGEPRYLTPQQIFGRIADGAKEVACYKEAQRGNLCSFLTVTYDPKFGLPVRIDDHSNYVSDYYWRLDVTELSVSQ